MEGNIRYEKKRITLQDFIVESCTRVSSSKDIDKESPQQSYEDLEGKIEIKKNIYYLQSLKENVQTQRKLECQVTKVCQFQQQIKELQQQNNEIKT